MKMTDGKLGTVEFAACFTLLIGIKGKDTTPDLLIFSGQNAAWVLPIVSFIVIFPLVILLQRLIVKHNKGLIELLYHLTGKAGALLIGVILFWNALSAIVYNSRSYADIINTMYYDQTSLMILYGLLLIGSFGVAYQGLLAVGGESWMFVGLYLLSTAFLIFLVWRELSWLHLFPLAGPGVGTLIRSGAAYNSIFFDAILLSAIFSLVRNERSFLRGSVIGIVIAAAWVTAMMMIYTMVFDYPAMEFINYPYHQLARVATIGGTNTHLEAIFMGLWIMASLLHFALYLYLTVYIFAKTLRIRNEKALLLPFTGLILLLGLLPENIITLNTNRMSGIHTSSIVAVALPIFLWLLDVWKERKSH